MPDIARAINKLVPFADASRPIWQDAIYSLILCTLLYFAPQLSWSQIRQWLRGILYRGGRRAISQGNEGVPQARDHDVLDGARQLPSEQRDLARPPAPTVEDDDDLGSDLDDDDNESLNDEEIAALIRQAEQNGVLDDPFGAGPANPQHRIEQLQPPLAQQGQGQPRRLRDPNRQVGAKKAKSLARRERIRAYHEFMREQGDMQRAQEASTAAVREKELSEARARRAAVEAEIEAKNRKLREEKRAAEREREEREQADVRRTVDLVSEALKKEGRVEVAYIAQIIGRDVAWVESVVKKEGMLEARQENGAQVITMLTSRGWIVMVSEQDIRQLQSQAATYKGQVTGKVSWTELGSILDTVLRKQHRLQ